MHAVWKIETEGMEVKIGYTNLHTLESMVCGCVDEDTQFSKLLVFMVLEGGGQSELILKEGKYWGYLAPSQTDESPCAALPCVLGQSFELRA